MQKNNSMVKKDNHTYKSIEGIDFRILESHGAYRTIRNDSLGILNRAHIREIECGTAALYFPNNGYVICEDDTEYNMIKKSKSYKCWRGILNRVGKGRYKNVSIHQDWLDYRSFKKFHDMWYREGFCLDKDLLSKGEKIYSPDTCCFLPPRLNCAIRECSVKTKKYAQKDGEYYFTISLGMGCSPFTVTCKTIHEYNKLYALYRCIKIRTLLSLHERHIMPKARRRLNELYNYNNYVKDTNTSTLQTEGRETN